ncbi:hypothetical protein Tco_0502480 [Tanacetum coccineum]
MRRTLMIILVFTLCEEQASWNSVLMRLIDDLLALDLIMHFGFSDQRLERTATFSISTNSEVVHCLTGSMMSVFNVSNHHCDSDNRCIDPVEVFNHVIQFVQNSIQGAITELVHLSLSNHLLLIIFVFVDYYPWLADYGVVFFEQKVRCIPIWLSEIEFSLITFNPELQIFHTFSDDDVPYP